MLTSGACRWSRPTTGISFGVIASAASAAKSSTLSGPDQLRGLLAELLLEPHRARVPRRLDLDPPGEPGGGLLERPILQQPREQQVACLEQRDVLGVDQLALRQQPRDLQVEQGRRDDEELARLVEPVRGLERAQVGDELVGHRAQRDLGDVELVLGDEREQQVERSAEVAQREREAGVVGPVPSTGGAALSSTAASGDGATNDQLSRELAVLVGGVVIGGEGGDRRVGDRRIRELHRAVDHGLEHLVRRTPRRPARAPRASAGCASRTWSRGCRRA